MKSLSEKSEKMAKKLTREQRLKKQEIKLARQGRSQGEVSKVKIEVPSMFRDAFEDKHKIYRDNNAEKLPNYPDFIRGTKVTINKLGDASLKPEFFQAAKESIRRLKEHFQELKAMDSERKPVVWCIGPGLGAFEARYLKREYPDAKIHLFDEHEGALKEAEKPVNVDFMQLPIPCEDPRQQHHQQDILSTSAERPDAIILWHVTKFLDPEKQQAASEHLMAQLRPGGLLLSEIQHGVVVQSSDFEERFRRVYCDNHPFHWKLVQHPQFGGMQLIPTLVSRGRAFYSITRKLPERP